MLIFTAYSQVPLTVTWPVLADSSSTKHTLYKLWVFQSNETQKMKEKDKIAHKNLARKFQMQQFQTFL